MAEIERKLQFILSLMDMNGITKVELARRLGFTPQNVFTYFQRDDMKLSLAQKIVNLIGYDMQIDLVKERPGNVVVDIENPVGKEGVQRLSFLTLAMSRYWIGRKELAEALGLNYTAVNRWFHVDDIAVSYIYKIADLYGLTVNIKAKAREENA